MKRIISLLIIFIGVNYVIAAQEYTYSSIPAIGIPTSCPANCGSFKGGICNMTLTSVNATSFTFKLTKCDGTAFTSNGSFSVGWDTDMQCTNEGGNKVSITGSTSLYSKSITVPASWFSNGTKSYWTGVYYNGTNYYYAGLITITRTPVNPTSPNPPSTVSTSLSGNNIDVSWSSSTGATGGYKVYMSTDGGNYNFMKSTTSTSYTFSTGNPGSNYCFKIAACNSTCSNMSSASSCKTIPNSIVCNSPTGLSNTVNTTSATVSWDAMTNATQYELRYRQDGYTNWTTTYPTTTSYTISPLVNNTTYYYDVKTNCPSGNESAYSSGSFTTLAATRIIAVSSNISYGNVQLGTSLTKSFTVSNTGNSELYVSSITLPSSFIADWSSGYIASGSSKTVNLTFSPSSATTFTGTITINSNATSGNNTLSVNGSGTPAPYSNLALGADLSFGTTNLTVGKTYTFSTKINNSGNAEWIGNFFLKDMNNNVIAFYNKAVPANSSILLLEAYTPLTASSNYSLTLYYQTGGSGTGTIVTPNGYANPIVINISNPINSGSCDLSGLSTSNEYYNSTLNLCARDILSGSSADGAVNVSDNLKRAHLAKIAFQGLYKIKGRTIPSTLVSDNFPTIYADLNSQTTTNAYYYQAVKALLYLEYGDGISPFDRNETNFNPDNFIARIDVLKVLMETFNIKPDVSTQTNPFPQDVDAVSLLANNPLKFAYLRKAVSLGIITAPLGTSNTNFRPFDNCVRGEAFVMLDRIIQKIDAGTITDPNPTASSYFTPLNITLENLAMGLSVQQGNFNHYTKSSFSIDGVVPMGFAHSYNSTSTDLPDDFYCVNDLGKGKTETYKPLGSGWSHSYHSYATAIEDKLVVHWGGGQIDIYKLENSVWKPMSVGVYDEATITTATSTLTIKSKSQIVYTFKRINPAAGPAILQLSSLVDRNGNTLTINYTAGQNGLMVISSVSDGQRSLNFSYKSGTNLLSQITDPLSRSIKFDYTFNSLMNEYQLTKFTDAKSQITQYMYGTSTDLNKCKLLEKIQLPKGNYIQNEYEANRRLSKTVTGKDGIPKTQMAVSVNTNYQTNSLTSKVDVTRANTTSSYNYTFNKNNSTTGITGSGSLSIAATYGNTTKPELPTAVQSNSTNISDIKYDSKGNVTSITKKAIGSTETQVITMTYNSFNDITSYVDPKGNTTYHDYDTKGNLIKVRAPESAITNITINSKGLPTQSINPEGLTVSMGYNSFGNLNSKVLSALNLSVSMQYDNASRLTSVTDFKGLKTSYSYDSNDNILTETNPMNYVTSYSYDANDNLLSITNAKSKATTMTYDNATDWLTAVSFEGASKKYDYNVDGTLKTFTKPDGIALTSTYDALGRVTSDGINTYTYDSNLRLSTITKAGKTLTYTYDGFNRITAVDYNDFTGNKVQYAYDANGNITSMTYPGGKKATYTYDGLNRMKSVTDWNSKTINYNYRKDDLLQSVSYPNGITTTFTYDAAGRQTAKTTNRSNGTVIAGYSFKLDSIGNITQETKNEPYQDVLLTASTTNYTYNTANRIQSDGKNEYRFDSNGNTSQRGTSTYTWDASDKMTSGDGLTFEYDGLGNRRATGSKRYMMDIMGMGNVLAECNASGTPTAYYLHGLGLEARILTNGTTEYYVSDYRGSTVAMVDASANITHKYQYDEFGNITQLQETDVNPFRYVGKYGVMFENDHLIYMRARYYDPTIGRFMSEDPIWSTNLYPYVDSNPLTRIDPEGKSYFNEFKKGWDVFKQLSKAYLDQAEQWSVYQTLLSREWYFNKMKEDPKNKLYQLGWALCDLWVNPDTRDILIAYAPMPKQKISIVKGVDLKIKLDGSVSLEFNDKVLTKILGKTGYAKILDMRTKDGRFFKDGFNSVADIKDIFNDFKDAYQTYKNQNNK